MDKDKLLEGKHILIVDDEPDVLDTLEDLLPMCITTKAASYDQAKTLLEDQYFDMAILDIMGVEGYELLKICNEKRVIGVMLTAYAVTPESIKKSYDDGATFLTDIYEAKEKGKSFWWRWFDRLADYCERKFGPDWQKEHGFKVR
jgi:CheY-like chemotaxis protein